jgi:hypothetical protein
MRALALRVAAAAFACAALAVAAQQASPPPAKPAPPAKAPAAPAAPAATFQGKDAFKNRLKPGLYEMSVEADLSNMPGVPKDKMKQSDKRQHCITQQDVDDGIANDPSCPATAYSAAGNQVSMAATCKDGARLETKIVFNPNGYTAEMKVNAKHEGKPISSVQRMTTRYLGPCPAGGAKK